MVDGSNVKMYGGRNAASKKLNAREKNPNLRACKMDAINLYERRTLLQAPEI